MAHTKESSPNHLLTPEKASPPENTLSPRTLSTDDFEIVKVLSAEDPHFDVIYSKLWEEFGEKGEIEERSVIVQRLNWKDSKGLSTSHSNSYSLNYDLFGVFKQGEFVAARDHTVIISWDPPAEAIVHLSHSLIAPAFRRQGISEWLRAWPIESARACLKAAQLPSSSRITLIAEMEAWDPKSVAHQTRVKSYAKGGFLMLDPNSVRYLQPDFRPSDVIDSSGGPQPIPLQLLVQEISPEGGSEMKPASPRREVSGAELRRWVSALYQMYGSSFRPKDMAVVWKNLTTAFPSDEARIALVEPYVPEGRP